ncbi:MAG: hypothetical protein WA981_04320 [Glaciecola sp.]
MIDKNGVEIKEGDTIKHVNFVTTIKVKSVNGVLCGGEIPLNRYHSSVLEIVT